MYSKRLTRITIKSYYYTYGALLLLLIFSTIQFLLILRHKSPYLSDSYFYKHMFYQMKGDSYSQARGKIISQINIDQLDKIGRKIFSEQESYQYSYSFFTKRPLYPFLARIVNIFFKSEYLAFITPVFFAYMGSVLLSLYFLKSGLPYFFTIFSLALFIAFYPFLDWSTYFLTDTIGFFFWLLQLLFIYKFVTVAKLKYLALYILSLIVSLFSREQSTLMLLMLIFLYFLIVVLKYKQSFKRRSVMLIKSTLVVIVIYFGISTILNQRTILESINYIQNNYSFFSKTYTLQETTAYLIKTIIFTHVVFLTDLIKHHWWFTFFVLGLVGIAKVIIFPKRKQFINLLMLSSGLASYFFVFIYPVLSYRFFYPVVLMIVYFAAKLTFDFFEERQKIIK